ncbi:MAG: hypothetical protein GC131_07790 [Alphaproteobacteria bacterium]|nr:hypothetical protein [Alphaproteobacteria bacterium]
MYFRQAVIFVFCLFVAAVVAAIGLRADQEEKTATTQTQYPQFAALRFNEVNLRTGPGKRYPVEWVYRREGMPVEITATFDVWRRVRDWEGSEGWVHKTMLRYRRTAIITGKQRKLHLKPDAAAPVVAQLEGGVIARLESCESEWCMLEAGGAEGWLRKADFWGAAAPETFD